MSVDLRYTNFTRRELDILQMSADGLSCSQISLYLVISINTIGGYKKNLFNKLGVHSMPHAVAEAYRAGLIE